MIILASASPRRIEMLINAGYDPVIRPASVIERLPFAMNPETATMYLALSKANDVMHSIQLSYESGNNDWIPSGSEIKILAADTVVVLDGEIIGKPSSENEAFSTLIKMRNRSHHVITGCCVITFRTESDCIFNASKHCFFENTEVFFKNYTSARLKDYVRTNEPYDKAGGYAIQGTFKKYVDRIDGDLDNVIGLPLSQVKQYL